MASEHTNHSMVVFLRDNEEYMKTLAFLTLLSQRGPKIVADSLNMIAQMWQREIKLHMPVDKGLARASVAVALAEIDTLFGVRAAVGSNVPYVPYLEFNENGRIAGGQLKAWNPGDPPILDWPAKRAQASDRTTLRAPPARNAMGEFVSAKDAGAAEFLPPFRGSWQLIAPLVVSRLRKKVGELLSKGKIVA